MVYLQHWHLACQDPSVAFDVKHTERPWVVLISSEERNQKWRMVGWGSECRAAGVWMVKTDSGWAALSRVTWRISLGIWFFLFLVSSFSLGIPMSTQIPKVTPDNDFTRYTWMFLEVMSWIFVFLREGGWAMTTPQYWTTNDNLKPSGFWSKELCFFKRTEEPQIIPNFPGQRTEFANRQSTSWIHPTAVLCLAAES